MANEAFNIIRLRSDLGLKEIELPLFVLQYLEFLRQNGRKKTTYIRYGYYIRGFLWWIEDNEQGITIEKFKTLKNDFYESYYEYLFFEKRQKIDSVKRVRSVLGGFARHITEHSIESNFPIENIETKPVQLYENDLVKVADLKKLLLTIKSKSGLTENQLKGRDYLVNRNISIVTLFYYYGLTMSELVSLKMNQVTLGIARTIEVSGSRKRLIQLGEDALIIHKYLKDVPVEVRPKLFTEDPLFIAFDFQRMTYRWLYGKNDMSGRPKELSRLAVQKMILRESRRAGVQVTAQKMRNTAILRTIMEATHTKEQIMKKFGFKNLQMVKRYFNFCENLPKSSLQDYFR